MLSHTYNFQFIDIIRRYCLTIYSWKHSVETCLNSAKSVYSLLRYSVCKYQNCGGNVKLTLWFLIVFFFFFPLFFFLKKRSFPMLIITISICFLRLILYHNDSKNSFISSIILSSFFAPSDKPSVLFIEPLLQNCLSYE